MRGPPMPQIRRELDAEKDLKEFEAEWPKWGYAESVLIDGDRLICYPGGSKGYEEIPRLD